LSRDKLSFNNLLNPWNNFKKEYLEMSIFIIAEIGINHNGDIKIAKQFIDVAK